MSVVSCCGCSSGTPRSSRSSRPPGIVPAGGSTALHPNLRGLTDLTFCAPDGHHSDCDVVFLSTPHRATTQVVRDWLGRSDCLIDLSADFRLRDPAVYKRYYGVVHDAPDLLPGFVPGWPERFRKELADAERISVPGCMASAAILGLYPLAAAALAGSPISVDGRVGPSGSGAAQDPMNAHAELSDAMRVYAATGHRNEAEIVQATGLEVDMSATGIPVVRGVQVLCRVPLTAALRCGSGGSRRTADTEPALHDRGTQRAPRFGGPGHGAAPLPASTAGRDTGPMDKRRHAHQIGSGR